MSAGSYDDWVPRCSMCIHLRNDSPTFQYISQYITHIEQAKHRLWQVRDWHCSRCKAYQPTATYAYIGEHYRLYHFKKRRRECSTGDEKNADNVDAADEIQSEAAEPESYVEDADDGGSYRRSEMEEDPSDEFHYSQLVSDMNGPRAATPGPASVFDQLIGDIVTVTPTPAIPISSIPTSSSPFTVVYDIRDTISLLRHSKSDRDNFQLAAFCLKNPITQLTYKQMLELPQFKKEGSPCSLVAAVKHLKQYCRGLSEIRFHVCEHFVIESFNKNKRRKRPGDNVPSMRRKLVSVKVPYLSLMQPISIWLACPSLLEELRESYKQNTEPYLASRHVLEQQILRSHEHFFRGDNQHDIVAASYGTGTGNLQVLLDYYDQWRPSFDANMSLPIGKRSEVIMIRVNLFVDDIDRGRRHSSGNPSTMHCNYQITAAEFSNATRGNLSSLATIVIMLCLKSCIKISKEHADALKKCKDSSQCCQRGHDHILALFTSELKQLAGGVQFEVNGHKILVFAFMFVVSGDGRARQSLFGFSEEFVQPKPCHLCNVAYPDLVTCIKDETRRSLRTAADMRVLFLKNNKRVGEPVTTACSAALESEGMKRVPYFQLLLPAVNPGMVVIDVFHMLFMGEAKHHLLHIFSLVDAGDKWTRVSVELERYYSLNRVEAAHDLKTDSDVRGLTAYDIKKLIEVSSLIIIKLRLLNYTGSVHLRKELNMWCCMVKICAILTQHSVTRGEASELSKLILTYLLEYVVANNMLRSNNHSLLHILYDLETYGAATNYSTWVNERIHGSGLKKHLLNINNIEVSLSLLSRYHLNNLIDMVQCNLLDHSLPIRYYWPTTICKDTVASNAVYEWEECADSEAFAVINYIKVFVGTWIQLQSASGDQEIVITQAFASNKRTSEQSIVYRRPAESWLDSSNPFLPIHRFSMRLQPNRYYAEPSQLICKVLVYEFEVGVYAVACLKK